MKLYTNECLYKDTYTIIEMMTSEMKNKIDAEFIEFLKNNQDDEFDGTINSEIPIKNQNLKEEIKIMLSLIYISYFCGDEKQKEILQLDEININNFYNKDIFSQKENPLGKEVEHEVYKNSENVALVEYNENFIIRFLNKIKSFFKK